MRRAVIVGIVSVLVTVAAAAYFSGVMAFQFLNAARGEGADAVLESAAAGAGLQFYVGAVIMVVGLVASISAARAVLMGLGVRNPLGTLRAPVILSVVGAVLCLWLSLPGVFVILLAGLAWLMVRVYDELDPRAPRGSRRGDAAPDGGLSDFV